MYQSPLGTYQAHEIADDIEIVAATPERRRKARVTGPRCSMRPLRVGDVARALHIAALNFGSEVNLIARSYVWHFAKRAGLEDVSAMWSRRGVRISGADETAEFPVFSSFVHGRDVAWLDLSRIESEAADLVLDALSQWPRIHRLLIVRVNSELLPLFVASGFELAGSLPDGESRHYYLHAPRERLASDVAPQVSIRFGLRDLPPADCEFSVVERDGGIIGLTGIYEVDFWRNVTWGAWGALDPAAARRDAVFDTLRLTEQRCREQGADWFCLETSDSEKYRHARRIYEIYGLKPMLRIPGFYVDGASGKPETFLVYGKQLDRIAEPASVVDLRRAREVAA